MRGEERGAEGMCVGGGGGVWEGARGGEWFKVMWGCEAGAPAEEARKEGVWDGQRGRCSGRGEVSAVWGA